jgi:Ni,Fe-hydrogenase III large subunit
VSAGTDFAALRNGQAVARTAVPELPFAAFRRAVVDAAAGGWRLAAFFGHAPDPVGPVEVHVVLADGAAGLLHLARTRLEADAYPSLTPDCPQAHLFERELAEQLGVIPEGHPWLKPVRYTASLRPGHDAWDRPAGTAPLPAVTDFFRVEGEEVHEVAVGPVHAGVIEPGHFRFQCHGEQVFHLEIALGFQHRGVEQALRGGPGRRSLHYAETLAGDTSVGHTTAYCEVVEALARCRVPLRAQALRGIGLELERLANHTGDLGALAQDVAFQPTAAACGRLRGDFLNATALLCGNRFGRGLVRPGGVGFDADGDLPRRLSERAAVALAELGGAARRLWDTASVQARFEDTGTVPRQAAEAVGLVGVAARACGLDRDVRHDFPAGVFRFAQVPVSTAAGGDVFARAYVRWLEAQRSGEFLREQLAALPGGPCRAAVGPLRPEALAVALVEGWRGEICHAALTDERGRFAAYKVVDPSFHNWFGLALALRGQQVSDFPLCNKSFNLSYCGHDL